MIDNYVHFKEADSVPNIQWPWGIENFVKSHGLDLPW